MDPAALLPLALSCAPLVHPDTASALVTVESGFNQHAIGVVGGSLQRQPQNSAEAQATAKALQAAGWNFSVGLSQINYRNFERLGLTLDSAFDPCRNLQAMQAVLLECFGRASIGRPDQAALRRALSCYYSGSFETGFRHGYVQRVAHVAEVAKRRTGVSSRPP